MCSHHTLRYGYSLVCIQPMVLSLAAWSSLSGLAADMTAVLQVMMLAACGQMRH